MRRRRFQQGSLTNVEGRWIAQWWEDGHRRKRTLGRVSEVTKAQAHAELATILAPLNSRQTGSPGPWNFRDFALQVYLPFYQRKWKSSTAATNEDRLWRHLLPEFGERRIDTLTRDELQTFLDRKAEAGLSFSTTDHLRWDLKQVLGMAVAEGYMSKNVASLLFTPRETRTANRRRMTLEEVRILLSVLGQRERLVCMLAVLAGMRPGEIFGLQWSHIKEHHLEVCQRIYRGKLDSPKTAHSVRQVALSDGLRASVAEWRSICPCTEPEAWVFPSENLRTPVAKENCWRRHISPKLKEVGLEWANFQVMRRTHSSLMRELGVDPKLVADQLGHTLDVSLNVYTETDLARRREAVNTLEATLNGAEWSRPVAQVV